MMSDTFEKIIRQAQLDAELNEEYYRERAHRAQRYQRYSHLLSAILGLGAVSSWLATDKDVWPILLALSAILSTVSQVMCWSEEAIHFRELAGKWTALAGKIRVFKIKRLCPDTNQQENFIEYQEEAARLQLDDTSKPRQKLIARMRHRISVRHGLLNER